MQASEITAMDSKAKSNQKLSTEDNVGAKLLSILTEPETDNTEINTIEGNLEKEKQNMVNDIIAPAVQKITLSSSDTVASLSILPPSISDSNTVCDASMIKNSAVSSPEQLLAEPPKTQREKKSIKSKPSSPPSQIPLSKSEDTSTVDQFLDSINTEPEITSPLSDVPQSSVPLPAAESKSSNDLEAWLDSVLDD